MYRFWNPATYGGKKLRVIDIGAITIGYYI
jgi:hypothetical protein